MSPARNPLRPRQNQLEARHAEDTVAAIRLHTRHNDPYEDWEKKTRREAFRTARKVQAETLLALHSTQSSHTKTQTSYLTHRSAAISAQIAQHIAARKAHLARSEEELRRLWTASQKDMWARVEGGIRWDEQRVQAEMEVERKRKEEVERNQRAEEAKRRLAEEKKRAEEEKKRLEEEQARKEEQREQEERLKQDEVVKARKAVEQAEAEERKALGLTTADEDWHSARSFLKQLKSGPMKNVKSQKQLKSTWSALRRQITPKIGQLTNDAASINLISSQLHALAMPSPPHPEEIYIPLLSSLAKAILLQAETEVTASKAAAVPLAQVTKNLLGTLPHFEDVLLAKLVQRVGTWGIPTTMPSTDIDSPTPFDENGLRKVMGYRDSENGREARGEYVQRVAGVMRVYFLVLMGPGGVDRPLGKPWQTQRYWVYFARMLGGAVGGGSSGVESAVAAEILFAALDVAGTQAAHSWGHQWIKVLGLLYDVVQSGKLGGNTPEGKAGRVRVQLEIERIMAGIA
ncbi:hypothetical protein FIBSPDRAFT_797908 [Athelia psychrophila]|uniref:mRNA export factor GLE1 n=1 Tax=Athelia psychrophila TaxID=1759441 RepID=A0A166C6T7_9AGAM|nr:hypothetical protein FIBSPDRAFT_797908 [Fibularhizoctonia sp. CBS 109695]